VGDGQVFGELLADGGVLLIFLFHEFHEVDEGGAQLGDLGLVAVGEDLQHEGLVDGVVLRDGLDAVLGEGGDGVAEAAALHRLLRVAHEVPVQHLGPAAFGALQSAHPVTAFDEHIQALDVALLQQLLRLVFLLQIALCFRNAIARTL